MRKVRDAHFKRTRVPAKRVGQLVRDLQALYITRAEAHREWYVKRYDLSIRLLRLGTETRTRAGRIVTIINLPPTALAGSNFGLD